MQKNTDWKDDLNSLKVSLLYKKNNLINFFHKKDE